MGRLGGTQAHPAMGLNMHSALCLTPTGECLGLVYQHIWAPDSNRNGQRRWRFPIEEKESFKWIRTLRAVEDHAARPTQQLVVISDREADFFEYYSQPRAANVQLLVRVKNTRRYLLQHQQRVRMSQLVADLPVLGEGTITLHRHPDRGEQCVRVRYHSTRVCLPPTYKQTGAAQWLQLIWVKEVAGASANKEAIECLLLTDLPANTLEDVLTVMAYYKQRWVVERFDYILKSGFAIERLQIESAQRLQACLSLYSLAAWHVLWLYRLGQSVPR